ASALRACLSIHWIGHPGPLPSSPTRRSSDRGTFFWQAVYSGDANNNPATSTCTDEKLVIGKNGPSIATKLSASTGSIGDTVSDSVARADASPPAAGQVPITAYPRNPLPLAPP